MAGFQDLRVYRKLDASGARLMGLGPHTWGAGKVRFVNSTSWGIGDDGNSGLDPDKPMAKIESAYDLCTAGAHDYIIVLDAWDNDTGTIDLDTSAVHIVGVQARSLAAPFPWIKINGDGTAPVFTVHGSNALNNEIAGLTMAANASYACITVDTGESNYASYMWIHDCSFAATGDVAYLAKYGIQIPAGTELTGGLVEDCVFGDEISTDGILIAGGMSSGTIRNCIFTGIGSVDINHTNSSSGTTQVPNILNNVHRRAHGASEGWAITIASCSGLGIITGNQASADYTTADANPYKDTNNTAQWGINWNVITATAPA